MMHASHVHGYRSWVWACYDLTSIVDPFPGSDPDPPDPDPRPDPTSLKKSTYFCKFIPFVIDFVGDEMRISLEKLKNA